MQSINPATQPVPTTDFGFTERQQVIKRRHSSNVDQRLEALASSTK